MDKKKARILTISGAVVAVLAGIVIVIGMLDTMERSKYQDNIVPNTPVIIILSLIFFAGVAAFFIGLKKTRSMTENTKRGGYMKYVFGAAGILMGIPLSYFVLILIGGGGAEFGWYLNNFTNWEDFSVMLAFFPGVKPVIIASCVVSAVVFFFVGRFIDTRKNTGQEARG